MNLYEQLMLGIRGEEFLNEFQIERINELLNKANKLTVDFDAYIIPTKDNFDLPRSIKGYIFDDKLNRFDDGTLVRTSRTLERRILSSDFSLVRTRNTAYLMINFNEVA